MIDREFVLSIIAIAREKQITVKAACLAFYAFNVLIGIVVLVSALITVFGAEYFVIHALTKLTGVETTEFKEFLRRIGGATETRQRAVSLAILIALWSSLRLFRAVEGIFAEVYGIRRERSLLRRLLDSGLVLSVVTVTLVIMAAVGSVFLFRSGSILGIVLGPISLWLGMLILFLPIYYWFSREIATFREVIPGTAIAASGWTISAIGLRFYISLAESVDIYGVIGAVLLVLTWLYIVGLAVVLGVIVNARFGELVEVDDEWDAFGD